MSVSFICLGDAIDKSASKAAEYAAVPPRAEGLGPTQGQLNRIATRSATSWESIAKVGRPLSGVGTVLEGYNGLNEINDELSQGKSVTEAAIDVVPKTAGSIAGGFVGVATTTEFGAELGAAVGTFVAPGPGTVMGGVIGGGLGGSRRRTGRK